jgi:membrane protein
VITLWRLLGSIRAGGRVAWRSFLRFQDHSGPDRAAAVAYYTLLSLLPLLLFLITLGVWVMGSFDVAYQGSLLLVRGVVVHLDPNSMESLRFFVEHARRFQWPGLLLLAWTSRRIFASLFSALEIVFGVPGRSFAKHNLVALSMVLVAGVGLLLTMALSLFYSAFEGLLMRFRSSGELQGLGIIVSWLVPIAVTFSFFYLVYRFVPRRVASSQDAALGALLATVLWELAKAGFAYYVRYVARYGGVYGTLQGIIVLSLWLEISVSIILYCGEIVAHLIHQRAAAEAAAAPAGPTSPAPAPGPVSAVSAVSAVSPAPSGPSAASGSAAGTSTEPPPLAAAPVRSVPPRS